MRHMIYVRRKALTMCLTHCPKMAKTVSDVAKLDLERLELATEAASDWALQRTFRRKTLRRTEL